VAVDEITVHEASKALGIKPGSVRKAFRLGRIEGRRLAARPGWSFLVLSRSSVEDYRRNYLGRTGPRRKEGAEQA
jgi:hypothetical protein